MIINYRRKNYPAIISDEAFKAVKLEKQSRSNVEKTEDGPKRKSKKFSSNRKLQ